MDVLADDACPLKRAGGIHSCRADGGRQRETGAGEHGGEDGEGQDARIGPQVEDDRRLVRGEERDQSRAAQLASRTPPAAPATTSARPSVSSSRTMRPRLAPSAIRTATSRVLADARASIRLPTVAQAARRSRTTRPKRSQSGRVNSFRTLEWPVRAETSSVARDRYR